MVQMRSETKALISAIRKLEKDLGPAIKDEIRLSAIEIAEVAARNAGAYHDTGSESAGFYIKGRDVSTYGQAASRSRSLNPRVEIVPEVPAPSGDGFAVSNVTRHFEVNELGSPARNRPARTMLRRATEEVRPKIGQRIQNRVRKVAKDAGLG